MQGAGVGGSPSVGRHGGGEQGGPEGGLVNVRSWRGRGGGTRLGHCRDRGTWHCGRGSASGRRCGGGGLGLGRGRGRGPWHRGCGAAGGGQCGGGEVGGSRGGAVPDIITAVHTDVVVEAHGELPPLVFIPADQPDLQAAAEHLPDLIDAHLGVALRPAFNPLRLLTHLAARGPDVVIGLHVSAPDPRGGEVHVKPLCPLALGLTAGCALAGGGPSGGRQHQDSWHAGLMVQGGQRAGGGGARCAHCCSRQQLRRGGFHRHRRRGGPP